MIVEGISIGSLRRGTFRILLPANPPFNGRVEAKTGYLVEIAGIPCGVDRRAKKTGDGVNGWMVTELSTGRSIVPWPHDTRKQALRAAANELRRQGTAAARAVIAQTPKLPPGAVAA